ncbi:MAG: Serine-tRNA ligase [Parcubacteria group bacterium GW2011_GWF1_40_6]|uniref:Serine--tRNA ligase n=2 Tax=Candidatus Nomuraibacteriota TaxID=1752729 RepID=A0A0G0U136_9BACT|nr:MAG: Serine-tRNA ligase [Candidatus Nomurabacteria bacterium GW2011_GWF2_40_12]KKR69882.1 MAG: Serine-tRNA ligase [Parcubacteria group bacterium GW2011_GWF1_40_6]
MFMLDIKFIRENKDIVQAGAKKKRIEIDIGKLISLDDSRLLELKAVEDLRSEVNRVSNDIARDQDPALKIQLIEEMRGVKEEIKAKEEKLKATMEEWQKIMLKIPNIPSVDTPEGPDDSGNQVVRSWGEKPQFAFTPKEHYELGKALKIIDTETAAEVSGSRYAYLKGDLVIMQFALIQMCLEILTNEETLKKIAEGSNISVIPTSFMPVVPPVFIRPIVQVKMARFMTPEEHYMFPNDDLMLIGSAEHTLGSMHMGKIFEEKDLPIRYAGYSTAFRREAGAAGKDTNGILRQHQFDKLEMEVFSLPENSMQEQNFLVAIQEYVLQTLKLPYQVVAVCTGDMGFPDSRQIDIETWMPGQNKYRETHSADSTGGFQARRLNTRVRRSDGKIEHVHMNDATVIAIGRTLIAIIENYQQADGSIKIPEVLRKYMGGKEFITK